MTNMFSDGDARHGIGFDSSWQHHRTMKSIDVQTDRMRTKDRGNISKRYQSVSMQTDPAEIEELKFLELDDDEEGDLAEFLESVADTVEFYLSRNNNSTTLDCYEPQWEEPTNVSTIQYTLRHKSIPEGEQVTAVAWNCTGSSIAVAYGRFNIDVDTHQSFLCIWNLDRLTVEPTKANVCIEVNSSLMAIAFHPSRPSIISGGTFNGMVHVWDLASEDEPLIAHSGLNSDVAHREPVARLAWTLNTFKDKSNMGGSRLDQYILTSVAGDGKLLRWIFKEGGDASVSIKSKEKNKKSRKSVDGHVVGDDNGVAMVATVSLVNDSNLILDAAHVLKTGSSNQAFRVSKATADTEMGATALSFSRYNALHVFIATEGGGIYKCNLSSSRKTLNPSLVSSGNLTCPIEFTFKPHYGPVYGLDCSPFHRNVFLSTSTDCTVHVSSALQDKPLFIVDPGSGYLFDAQWSPTRPMVFAVTTGTGCLLIFDLMRSRTMPVESLQVNVEGKPVHTVAFNSVRAHRLATGDTEGNVQVWRLADEYTSRKLREDSSLDDLCTAASDT